MGVGGQCHTPTALPLGKRACTHCIGSWVSPRANQDKCGNSRPHQGSIPRLFQPLVERCENYEVFIISKNRMWGQSVSFQTKI
jgi:hypothetical protein